MRKLKFGRGGVWMGLVLGAVGAFVTAAQAFETEAWSPQKGEETRHLPLARPLLLGLHQR